MIRTLLLASLLFAGAFLSTGAVLSTKAMACDDRYPDTCTRSASSAQAAPGKSAKRGHVRSKARYASRYSKRTSRHARASRSRHARQMSRRALRAARSGRSQEVAVAPDIQAGEPTPVHRPALSSAAQRRFRAFISPSPLADNEVEPWRGPRFEVVHLVEPASPLARVFEKVAAAEVTGSVAGDSAADDPAAGASAVDLSQPRALDASVVASHTAIVTAPVVPMIKIERVVAAKPRGEEPFELFSLRGLMLALGGAATLASALRLLVGV